MKRNNDMFGMMQKATKKAFERVGRVGGVEVDPDLALYDTLKPQHFTELMKEYGEQPIIDYIKTMESKKIMNGRK